LAVDLVSQSLNEREVYDTDDNATEQASAVSADSGNTNTCCSSRNCKKDDDDRRGRSRSCYRDRSHRRDRSRSESFTPNAKVGGQNVFVANWGLITWNGSTLRPKGGQGTRDDITLIRGKYLKLCRKLILVLT
jgi:hypothetical protein